MLTLKYKKDNYTEKGNVLFLILIAVALFAALSYAVTQSTRTGGGSGDNETALISSAQLTQYPASIRTAVVRMIIGGVDIQDLEFNPPSDFASCTASGSDLPFCVFHPTGGGATFAYAPTAMMASDGGNTAGEWVFNAENEIELLGTTGSPTVTAATADLIAFLPGITQTLCSRINKELGLPTTPPTETTVDYATQKTDGVSLFSTATATNIIDGAASADALEAEPFGCFVDTTPNPDIYVYYHVLVER